MKKIYYKEKNLIKKEQELTNLKKYKIIRQTINREENGKFIVGEIRCSESKKNLINSK